MSNCCRERCGRQAVFCERRLAGGNTVQLKRMGNATAVRPLLGCGHWSEKQAGNAQQTAESECHGIRTKSQSESPRDRETWTKGEALPSSVGLTPHGGVTVLVHVKPRENRAGIGAAVTGAESSERTQLDVRGEAADGVLQTNSDRAGLVSERMRSPVRGIGSDDERRWT